MDLLKRNLAPLSDAAWDLVDTEAKGVFPTQLTARRFVDVEGPKGWDYAAEPLGRLSVLSDPKKDNVGFGLHGVLPLTEVRSPFEVGIWELDNVERGAQDIELDALFEAAKKLAAFEERAIYYGFDKILVKGFKEVTAYKPFAYPKNPQGISTSIEGAVSAMLQESIQGPYSLVVGPEKWADITSCANGYPVKKHLAELLEGDIIMSPHISEMFVVSKRGGDFKLTLGSDIAIGYESHNSVSIQLFFTESFTFRVLEPKAVVVFE